MNLESSIYQPQIAVFFSFTITTWLLSLSSSYGNSKTKRGGKKKNRLACTVCIKKPANQNLYAIKCTRKKSHFACHPPKVNMYLPFKKKFSSRIHFYVHNIVFYDLTRRIRRKLGPNLIINNTERMRFAHRRKKINI